jgi:hypothetical protein
MGDVIALPTEYIHKGHLTEASLDPNLVGFIFIGFYGDGDVAVGFEKSITLPDITEGLRHLDIEVARCFPLGGEDGAA